MPFVADLPLPSLDLADPALRGERWHATMASLAAEGAWLARAPLATVVLDREAGEWFLRTRAASFPGKLLGELFGIVDGPLHEQIQANIINVGGDAHRRLRALVNPALAPRAVDRYRPAMRRFLEELWGRVQARGDGRCEAIEALCKPYPALTIATVMGAPLSDAPRLHDWSMWIQRQFDPIALSDPDVVAAIQRKTGEFYAWVRPLIAARRALPAGSRPDDLISALIAAEEDGDRLDDSELENLVLNVLVGGVDTTQSQLAHALRLLAGHPQQWAALRADPGALAAAAVEEALRFEPITPFTARLLTEEVVVRDVTFPAGTVLMVCAFAANRDPAAFPDPDRFDVTRATGGPRTLTFGAGIHYCVGANLARAELVEALTFLASRVRTLHLDGEPVMQPVSGIYGTESLPLGFT
jgi:cytochrome P450